MNKYRLLDNDQRQIAHYIAQRSLAGIAPGQPRIATERYLEVFNNTLEILSEYNKNIRD
jgi:hypothetical protein